jgi:hypothetical protein
MNQFNPCYSLTGGVNFLFSLPIKFQSFKLGLSVGYNTYNCKVNQSGIATNYSSAYYYSIVKYNETLTVKNSLLLTNLYLMYLINPLSKIKLYLKAGVNVNFSMGGDIDVFSRDTAQTTTVLNGNPPAQGTISSNNRMVTIRQDFISFIGSVGVISHRSRLEFSYWPNTDLAAPTGYFLAPTVNTFKFGSMALYYYFSLFGKNGKRTVFDGMPIKK